MKAKAKHLLESNDLKLDDEEPKQANHPNLIAELESPVKKKQNFMKNYSSRRLQTFTED